MAAKRKQQQSKRVRRHQRALADLYRSAEPKPKEAKRAR